MYQDIILSTFFITWLGERIYYYCIHNNNDEKPINSLLNLNTPLSNSYNAQYNPVTLPENDKKNSQLNELENDTHL